MSACSVRLCKTSKTNEKNGIILHKFPENRKQKWLDAINRSDRIPSKYSVICTRHFEEKFIKRTGKVLRLTPDAIPSLFVPEKLFTKNSYLDHTYASLSMIEGDNNTMNGTSNNVKTTTNDENDDNYPFEIQIYSPKPEEEDTRDDKFLLKTEIKREPIEESCGNGVVEHIDYGNVNIKTERNEIVRDDDVSWIKKENDGGSAPAFHYNNIDTHESNVQLKFEQNIDKKIIGDSVKIKSETRDDDSETVLKENDIVPAFPYGDIDIHETDIKVEFEQSTNGNPAQYTSRDDNNIIDHFNNLSNEKHKDDVPAFQYGDIDIVETDVKVELEQKNNSGDNNESSDKTVKSVKKVVNKFACDICDKKYRYPNELKGHRRSHTGEKPFECLLCHMKFAKLNRLKAHEKIHTDEKRHECKVCNKKFPRMSTLKDHERLHTGEKPYECEICLRKFANLSNFKSHVRVHSGESPYACKLCEMRYTRLTGLKRHMRDCHPDEELKF